MKAIPRWKQDANSRPILTPPRASELRIHHGGITEGDARIVLPQAQRAHHDGVGLVRDELDRRKRFCTASQLILIGQVKSVLNTRKRARWKRGGSGTRRGITGAAPLAGQAVDRQCSKLKSWLRRTPPESLRTPPPPPAAGAARNYPPPRPAGGPRANAPDPDWRGRPP
jgi:hypothetical protein